MNQANTDVCTLSASNADLPGTTLQNQPLSGVMSHAKYLLEQMLGAVELIWCHVCERGLGENEQRYIITDNDGHMHVVCTKPNCRQEVYAGLGIGGFTAVLS